MSKNPMIAQRALVHVCTRLSMSVVPNSDDDLMLQRLGEILADCYACSAQVLPLRNAAERLVLAKNARSRSLAELALSIEVKKYHGLAANTLIDEWLKGRGRA
ncbi:hypothetical protein [Phaeobacter inhibens]|uniref:Uncharacterized protein n=1 Tax=Phaeobacter inhibens TaxID=221822 RepID=A0A2I7KHE0_9RHOB|nr:hypothetical protein [Phaeobacter inhibens]AUR01991.1 hypothetical protein PhaeoP88_04679 [Phaeobacter inhibens]